MTGAQDNAVIVFKGVPHVWYGPKGVGFAEEQAAELCEQDQEDYSIMVVPVTALRGLVARYHGVILHAMDKVLKEES
jgi:hypothetical protein